MASAIRLRDWQRAALEKLDRCSARDFLAVATPGAGKTTFALTAVRRALAQRRVRRFVVVVPTQHLKLQWANAAERFDIHIDPETRAPIQIEGHVKIAGHAVMRLTRIKIEDQ